MKGVQEWRLHVGAHKTATTHLQESLKLHRGRLLESGTDFLPMEEIRPLGLTGHRGRRRWRARLSWPLRRRIEALISPVRSGPDRVAISEEDFIGLSPDLLGKVFYPNAEPRLGSFAPLSEGRRELHVFLAVRSIETLLPSAYVQTLRGRAVLGGFDSIRMAALDRPPSWTELARRIRRTLPKARLTIWTFEEYCERDWEILSHFVGAAIPPGEFLAPPEHTRSLSSKAVSEMEALSHDLSFAERTRATQQIASKDMSRGESDRFMPFSAPERALLREAYEEDLARLDAEQPDARLRLMWRNAGDTGQDGRDR